ncbi:hypothetical protein [Nonomuraea dietziae]|uniref:hypothetical protein n=1 Tax=Nonomuraea dietziae TaxID=65515 RepID=UPI0031DB0D7F
MLAGGVLVGAVNIYLASSLLPTAVARHRRRPAFYAWNHDDLPRRHGDRDDAGQSAPWPGGGTSAPIASGFAVFLMGSLACAASRRCRYWLPAVGIQGIGAGVLSGLGFAHVIGSALPRRLWTPGQRP